MWFGGPPPEDRARSMKTARRHDPGGPHQYAREDYACDRNRTLLIPVFAGPEPAS